MAIFTTPKGYSQLQIGNSKGIFTVASQEHVNRKVVVESKPDREAHMYTQVGKARQLGIVRPHAIAVKFQSLPLQRLLLLAYRQPGRKLW